MPRGVGRGKAVHRAQGTLSAQCTDPWTGSWHEGHHQLQANTPAPAWTGMLNPPHQCPPAKTSYPEVTRTVQA